MPQRRKEEESSFRRTIHMPVSIHLNTTQLQSLLIVEEKEEGQLTMSPTNMIRSIIIDRYYQCGANPIFDHIVRIYVFAILRVT